MTSDDDAIGETHPTRARPDRPDRPTPTWRAAAIGALAGLVPLAALIGWIVLKPAATANRAPVEAPVSTGANTPAPAVTPAPASVERQTAARRLSGWRNEPYAPLDVETATPTQITTPIAAKPPFDAIDAALFDTADSRIRLVGILPVARDEVCFDEAGKRFACGLQARASLQNFMRGKAVVCRPAVGAVERRDGMIEAFCSAGGMSLAMHQVAAGFAFPQSREDDHLHEAMAKARAERRGVWAGPYQMPLVDRAEADSRAIRFGGGRLSLQPTEMPQTPTKPGKR